MRTKRVLNLADAELVLVAAMEKADQENWKVSMAVVDEAGCLMTFRRLDGASISTAQAAIDKARSAALTRRPTKFFEEMVAADRVAASMIHGVFAIEVGCQSLSRVKPWEGCRQRFEIATGHSSGGGWPASVGLPSRAIRQVTKKLGTSSST